MRYERAGVALGKGEVGDRPRPHLKIRPHSKNFLRPLLKGLNIFIYTKIKKIHIFKTSMYENNFWYLFL
jgi:hypothetical protein